MSSPQDHEEALFDRVLEVPAAERGAWLDRECAGDPFLHARLQALVAAHDRPDARLESRPGESTATAEGDEALGQVLGRYQLLEKLGEGGCGVVYVAEQSEPIRRRVALKIIKLGMDTRQVVARFEAERQALAMMDHSGIAKVLDAGTTEQGRPYFVMELVHGTRITDYCDQHRLSTRERLGLFIKVCQAIQHAHQKGVIHRDIKPSNILVTRDDGVPVPKVIDFGIAKATEGRLTDSTVFTQQHQFIGTPAYMSPEQAEMRGLDVDTRSDIYSLGVVLYELLTGAPPFDTRDLVAAGLDQLRKIIREQEPVPPSTRLGALKGEALTSTAVRRSADATKLLHQLQGDLDWIVMKCLEKDRARRYESASGLAADVRRHLDHEPVVARPPSPGYRFRKALRRNKLAFTAAGLVVGALLAGISASLWQAVRATTAERLAELRLSDSEKARTKAVASENRALAAEREATTRADAELAARTEAEAVATLITGVFRSPNPARDGRTVTVAETLDLASKKLEKDLGIPASRRAALQGAMAETYDSLGLFREAAALREKVRDHFVATAGPDHPETLVAMHDLANSYFQDGRQAEAVKLQEAVGQARRRVLGPQHNETLQTMLSLSLSYHSLGRHAEALQLREDVLAARRELLGPEHFETLWALKALAQSYQTAGRLDEALRIRERLLVARRQALPPEHPQTLGAIADLAYSYHALGRLEEALRLREEVLPLLRRVRGPEHPDTVKAGQALADSYLAAGRIQDLLPLLAEASVRNPVNTTATLKLAALQLWFGRDAEYATTRQRALDWGGQARNPNTAEAVARLASLGPYANPAMNEAALRLAGHAMQHRQGNSLAVWFPLTLGMVEYRSGRYPEADAALLAAIQGGGNNPRILATAAFYRAMSLFQLGREAEARQLFSDTERLMTPLPVEERNPLADPKTNQDDIIQWLAHREAKVLLNTRPAAQR
jgi:eukaryotic-like serine/threonine-protein kinase